MVVCFLHCQPGIIALVIVIEGLYQALHQRPRVTSSQVQHLANVRSTEEQRAPFKYQAQAEC